MVCIPSSWWRWCWCSCCKTSWSWPSCRPSPTLSPLLPRPDLERHNNSLAIGRRSKLWKLVKVSLCWSIATKAKSQWLPWNLQPLAKFLPILVSLSTLSIYTSLQLGRRWSWAVVGNTFARAGNSCIDGPLTFIARLLCPKLLLYRVTLSIASLTISSSMF